MERYKPRSETKNSVTKKAKYIHGSLFLANNSDVAGGRVAYKCQDSIDDDCYEGEPDCRAGRRGSSSPSLSCRSSGRGATPSFPMSEISILAYYIAW